MAVAALWLLAIDPAAAHAQAGWYVIPSLGVTEEFDDNVFGQSSNRSADLITRFSPGITSGYRSRPLTFLITGGLDGEFFARHSELTGVPNRKRVNIQSHYVPAQPTTLSLTAGFVETTTPTELQPQTGIEAGRRDTQQWSVSPSLVHRFDPTLSGNASYTYSRTLSGDITSAAHEGRVGLSSVLTRVDTGTAHYTLRLLDSGAGDSTTSHTLSLGWSRKLTPTTVVSIAAGPRFSEGAIEPDVNAGLTHTFKTGTLSLSYARTETTLIGQAGTVETNSLSGALTFTPERSLQVSLGTGASQTTSETIDVTVYRANATVSYRLTKWLSANLAYRFTIQQGGPASIYHNVLSIGLDATYPIRAD